MNEQGASAAGEGAGVPQGAAAGGVAPGQAKAATASLFDLVGTLLRDLPGMVSDRVELLALELERALRSAAQLVLLAIAMAVLAGTAWITLWAAVVVLLVDAGLPWPWAALALLAVHGLAIALALQRARRLIKLLALPATRRHLTGVHGSPQAAATPRPSSDERPRNADPSPAAP